MRPPSTQRSWPLKRRLRTAAMVAVCFLFSLQTAAAHPFHVSLAEAEFNQETGALEVALRVHPTDLEQALRAQETRPVDLDRSKGIDRMIAKYLESHFQIRDEDGRKLNGKWVGKEVSIKEAWLYFEFAIKDRDASLQITQAFFFETLEDQVNTINFKQGKRVKSLCFTRDTDTQTLRLPIE
jgi:hypothetical protein